MRLRDPYEAACVRGRAIPLINMTGGTARKQAGYCRGIALMRFGRAASSCLVLRPDGQQQCILFAFCCSKTKAAELRSGRLSNQNLAML
jgi:hypothetical protein